MKMQDVKEIAKDRGVKAGTMKKVELIKTIQRAEGNEDCFGEKKAEACGQDQCLWREDCE